MAETTTRQSADREADTAGATRLVSLAAARLFPIQLAAAVLSFIFLFPLVLPMPIWDQWRFVDVWAAHFQGRSVARLLLAPDNCHWTTVPRYILYLTGLATNWNVQIEVILIYLVALATACSLCLLSRHAPDRIRILLACVIAVTVFSFRQFETFLSGFNLTQQLEQLAVVLMILTLTGGLRLGWSRIVSAMLLATLATFSWGAGLLAWPVGALGLVLRLRKELRTLLPALVVWSLPAVLCARLVRSATAGLTASIDWRNGFFLTVCTLGLPIDTLPFPSPARPAILGGLIAAFFAAAALWVVWRRLAHLYGWVLLGSIGLASALAIGIARSGLPSALVSHYATATYPVLLSFAAIAMALIDDLLAATGPWLRWAGFIAGCIVAAVPIAIALVVSVRIHPTLRSWNQLNVVRTEKLLMGTISDDEIRSSFYPDPHFVRDRMDILKRYHLTVF